MKIKNQSDFIEADKKINLNKITSGKIIITHVDDIWDGPLSGSCLWQGKEYYFFSFDQLIDDNSGDKWPYKYLLIELTAEQSEKNIKQRKLVSEWKKNSASKEYILEEFKQQIIEKNQIIGWFNFDLLQENIDQKDLAKRD